VVTLSGFIVKMQILSKLDTRKNRFEWARF
jgi:hypothetical protein